MAIGGLLDSPSSRVDPAMLLGRCSNLVAVACPRKGCGRVQPTQRERGTQRVVFAAALYVYICSFSTCFWSVLAWMTCSLLALWVPQGWIRESLCHCSWPFPHTKVLTSKTWFCNPKITTCPSINQNCLVNLQIVPQPLLSHCAVT